MADNINVFDLENGSTSQHPYATVPVIPKMTMTTLGLLTRAVNMSQVSNPTNMGPDDYNVAAHDADKDVWWLALPTELFGAMTPERLRGNMALFEHINSNTNVARYIEEFNNYHGATSINNR